MAELLFGTDPEAFGAYEKGGKLYALPPYYFRKYLQVPASSDPKHPVFFEGDGFKLHEDGAAFEMSIRPSKNPRELFDMIHECSRLASENILSKFPDDCLPVLQFMPTVGFEVSRWENESEDFFMSTTFGCDPDIDAFRVNKKVSVVNAGQHPFRYGGGHIHFSGSPEIEKDAILATKVCALTAGLAAIGYSDVPELEKERTFLYGRPGKFRPQFYGKNEFGPEYSFGIEYRTPSNRWVSSWDIAEKVFEWARIGISELLPNTELANKLLKELSSQVVKTILSADQAKALEILSYVKSSV